MEKEQQIDLKSKSIVELKAMAYDFGVIINEYKQMLNIVNQEIISKAQSQNGLKPQEASETATSNEAN